MPGSSGHEVDCDEEAFQRWPTIPPAASAPLVHLLAEVILPAEVRPEADIPLELEGLSNPSKVMALRPVHLPVMVSPAALVASLLLRQKVMALRRVRLRATDNPVRLQATDNPARLQATDNPAHLQAMVNLDNPVRLRATDNPVRLQAMGNLANPARLPVDSALAEPLEDSVAPRASPEAMDNPALPRGVSVVLAPPPVALVPPVLRRVALVPPRASLAVTASQGPRLAGSAPLEDSVNPAVSAVPRRKLPAPPLPPRRAPSRRSWSVLVSWPSSPSLPSLPISPLVPRCVS
ncbi:uncharacterized protein CMC5_045650 [Chondromyces crocatus]|uniref:Uncharacterized protein n=1 Tax=Chondromyces crocatus TaxID=52 RepID=A0A0K1EI87_CHOCO|nr:uncharacterized protein CMC5_045650 [Chondromyces crocatus]